MGGHGSALRRVRKSRLAFVMEHSLSGRSSVGVGAGAERSDADSVFGFSSPWRGGNERTTTNTGGTGGGTTQGGTRNIAEFESASNIRTIQHGTFCVEGLPVFVTHCNTDFSLSLDNHTDNRYHADVPQFG